MNITEIRDIRQRVRAYQQTESSCVAAAIVDALADITNWDTHQALTAQHYLSEKVGDRPNGATLDAAARAASKLFGRIADFQAGTVEYLEEPIRWASMGFGVVVGLGNPNGVGGHAIRIRAGDIPDTRPFDALPPSLRQVVMRPGLIDRIAKVQIFDPWMGPERFPELVEYSFLRARFQNSGGRVLLISPKVARTWP